MNWIVEPIVDGVVKELHILYFNNKKDHRLSVGESNYIEGKYHMYYILNGFTEIKEGFEAASLEEAKERAVKRVKNLIHARIGYWEGVLHQIETA